MEQLREERLVRLQITARHTGLRYGEAGDREKVEEKFHELQTSAANRAGLPGDARQVGLRGLMQRHTSQKLHDFASACQETQILSPNCGNLAQGQAHK